MDLLNLSVISPIQSTSLLSSVVDSKSVQESIAPVTTIDRISKALLRNVIRFREPSKGRLKTPSQQWLKAATKTKQQPHRPKSRKPKTPSHTVEYLPKSKCEQLRHTARQLMTPGLGILAADDSVVQLGQKLRSINMVNIETNRLRYHEMLLGVDAGEDDLMNFYFSGVLMREESLGKSAQAEKKLSRLIIERDILLGIRFDTGVEKLVGCDREYVSTGLDSVMDAIKRTTGKGLKFGLFRCVFRVSELTPSTQALFENSLILAKFAVICQQSGIVPIVAPEVLTEGSHGHEEARSVLREILTTLVKLMVDHHVFLEGTLIRVAACKPGLCFKGQKDLKRVADDTTRTLNECLPPAVGGVLLSRDEDLCTSLTILNNIQNCHMKKPFFVSFCFSRVIQEDVVAMWAGQNKNRKKARTELMRRAELCSLATFGQAGNIGASIFITCEESFMH
ncbi:fructose-bisphosphate aldolase [Elysia marginata]|uniref:fructose-bisphosphate aldolase n=1 Tax=Elysia marginata TaxID=1093978 RepID=A0AAV4F942_9GAST|nr:fructose-bisphosphate aldolase [Elysia marginata]